MQMLVFAYDFPHHKTVDGLYRLASMSNNEITVWLAPKVPLNYYVPSLQTFPARSLPESPRSVCSRLGLKFVVGPHSASTWATSLSREVFDVGIILGARVLRKDLIESLGAPILNFHPGVLPANRGLYNIHWAVLNMLPQGVTTHVISPSVDRGRFVSGSIAEVFPGDSLMDIGFRLANLEIAQIIKIAESISQSKNIFSLGEIGQGTYNEHLNPSLEASVKQTLNDYTTNYADHVKAFLETSDYPYTVVSHV